MRKEKKGIWYSKTKKEVKMKLVFASDSFKGTVSSEQAAEFLTKAARECSTPARRSAFRSRTAADMKL